MTPEQKLNGWIAAQFDDADVTRIESTTMNGIPDINVCLMGMDAWIESKVADYNRTSLRKEQWAWGTRRSMKGGSCFVVSDYPTGVAVWRFPDVQVKSVGSDRPLEIVNPPHLMLNRADPGAVRRQLLRKFIFPCI